MSNMSNPKGAWRMCVGACILQLCLVGLSINVFSVYLPYLLQKCNLSNTESANLLLARNCVAFASLFFVGKVYEKLELRVGITVAFLLFALGMYLYCMATTYLMLLLGALTIGLGYGLGGMYPVSLLLHRWFRIHEPVALGISTACTGLAVIFGSPLITSISERYSVNTMLTIHSIMLVLGALVCFALIRNWPKDVPHRKQVAKKKKFPFRFRPMYIAAICIGINANTAFQFVSMHLRTQGISAYEAAAVVSALGTALMVSKFLFGGAVDHFGTRKTNRVFMVISAMGLGLSCLCGQNYALAMTSMILFGLGLAYSTIGFTVYAEDLDSVEEFENRVREYQICYTLGALISSPVPGILADLTGDYVLFYAIAAVAGIVALVIIENNYRAKKEAVQ